MKDIKIRPGCAVATKRDWTVIFQTLMFKYTKLVMNCFFVFFKSKKI